MSGQFQPLPTSLAVDLPDALQFALIADIVVGGGNGGTFTSGAWRTRTLTAIQEDPDNLIISLAANVATIEPGKYLFLGQAPAYQVRRHKTRLNINSGTYYYGSSEFSGNSIDFCQNYSVVFATFESVSNITISIEHRCEATKTSDGFGVGGLILNDYFAQLWVGRIL